VQYLPRIFEEIGFTDVAKFAPPRSDVGKCEFLDYASLISICESTPDIATDFLPNLQSEKFINTNLKTYVDLISSRNQENNNSNQQSEKYQIYLDRMAPILLYAQGICVDVGADNPQQIMNLLPNSVAYVGIEPHGSERIQGIYLGLAEFLPFQECSVDTVMFNTSLDHILDIDLAIDNAKKALKIGGRLLVSSLVWITNYEMWRDDVHFHHLKPAQLERLLDSFDIIYSRTYQYGQDQHRYGAFIVAEKSSNSLSL